jgi:hypothetical protein
MFFEEKSSLVVADGGGSEENNHGRPTKGYSSIFLNNKSVRGIIIYPLIQTHLVGGSSCWVFFVFFTTYHAIQPVCIISNHTPRIKKTTKKKKNQEAGRQDKIPKYISDAAQQTNTFYITYNKLYVLSFLPSLTSL